MLTYYEERRRIGFPSCLYRVRSWYLLGVRVYRRWEQLTVKGTLATESEMYG
jgi:hypothetical protein